MNSLRQIIESSPSARHLGLANSFEAGVAQPLAPAPWDWAKVEKLLIIRLRSIGDTVLTTPSLVALRRFVPHAKIHILLEDWVAPLLDGSNLIDRVISTPRHGNAARARLARELHRANYQVVYNLHGGTTATFLTRASGAAHRVGYTHYQYARLHNHAAPSPQQIWSRPVLHSVEQQLALIGWTGVPVTDRPATQLTVTEKAAQAVKAKLAAHNLDDKERLALIHPAAAFETKQWPIDNFVKIAEDLSLRGLTPVALVSPKERQLAQALVSRSSARVIAFDNLSLPEVIALAARASLFVGNDSGIAHIAAAVQTPSVVIFGSSNVAHWRPWTTNQSEVVREELPCQPCHGYFCAEFEKPQCILKVPVERVVAAIDRITNEKQF